MATIRTLYKRLCHLRRQALSGIDDSNLARLNILIAITGGYFGQGESYSSLYLNGAQMEEPALFEEPSSLPDPFSVSGFDNSSAEEGELLDAETL